MKDISHEESTERRCSITRSGIEAMVEWAALQSAVFVAQGAFAARVRQAFAARCAPTEVIEFSPAELTVLLLERR